MNKINTNTCFIGREVINYEEVDSTNIVAKALAKQGVSEGALIVAEMQTAGKGRLGRHWVSPRGEGIWMSLILKPDLPMNLLPELTVLSGFAMCEAIRAVTHQDIKIKWPNDLVLNNKKICGVLCESQLRGKSVENVIVGIGVNVNTKDFDETLVHATSLWQETNQQYSREKIIEAFCKQFESYYVTYKESRNLNFILNQYKTYCVTMNQKVILTEEGRNIEVEVVDLTAQGELVVLRDRKLENVRVGEVSVRGLYGYV